MPNPPVPLIQIPVKPGIKRDGTMFDSAYYADGLWCRWHEGRPKKMGGYRLMDSEWSGPVRGCDAFLLNGTYYVHGGSANVIQQGLYDSNGVLSGAISNRTPTSNFNPSQFNIWTMCRLYDSGSNTVRLMAHCAPNLANIDSNTTGYIFYGDEAASTALTPVTSSATSGGIVNLAPYLFWYGSNGFIGWSVAGQPTTLTGAGTGNAYPTAGKVVAALPIRGGSTAAPAGIFWALDALVIATFVGGTVTFNFNRIATQSYSILSSQSPVESNGLYFWPGNNRFLFYNGTVQEMPNNMSIDWFYNNLNVQYRQKVFSFSNPRWGEIGWAFPFGDSTECNQAIIFNTRENCWYDTRLPDTGRSASFTDGNFIWPIQFEAGINDSGGYNLWQHEYGTDRVVGSQQLAINSYFTTCDVTAASLTGSDFQFPDNDLILDRVEPDFVMTGGMMMQVASRQYAQSQELVTNSYNFTGSTGKIDTRDQGGRINITFQSNVVGGNYFAGQNLYKFRVGQMRR